MVVVEGEGELECIDEGGGVGRCLGVNRGWLEALYEECRGPLVGMEFYWLGLGCVSFLCVLIGWCGGSHIVQCAFYFLVIVYCIQSALLLCRVNTGDLYVSLAVICMNGTQCINTSLH